MRFVKTCDNVIINNFRTALYQKISAPIDAMWEQLYIASSQCYLIEYDTENIGYCCIDTQDSLLQILLSDKYSSLMCTTVLSLVESKLISTASLSSIEPVSFNACLFHSKSTKANTLCFQYFDSESNVDPLLNIELVSKGSIPAIKTFLKSQIGFNDNFGYTENLVERNEFYVVTESNTIIATGECRLSDSQPDFADLGVIVNKDYRGRGIATGILRQLAKRVLEIDRVPICSTTHDNIASQRAIEKAGFYCSHIIFDMSFTGIKNQNNNIL